MDYDRNKIDRFVKYHLHDAKILGQEREKIQKWIRKKVIEFFTDSDEVARGLCCNFLKSLLRQLDPKEALHLFLCEMTEFVFRKAPEEVLKREDAWFIAKAAIECSVLGNTFQVAMCLLEVGQYALDIYREYSSRERQKFLQYIVERTLTLLRECARMMGPLLLSAIVGYFIGNFALTLIRNMIYLASYVIHKGFEWAKLKSLEQIVRDMTQDFENKQTKSTVIFRTLEEVETLRRQ